MNEKSCIIKTIIQMSGKYSEFEVFTDWVRIMAYSIQNACCIWHDDEWNDREEMYKTVMGKYSEEEQTKLCEMYAWLVEAYDKEISDILGEIFMSKDFGSSMAGQFFTPFHISLMTAIGGYGLGNEECCLRCYQYAGRVCEKIRRKRHS